MSGPLFRLIPLRVTTKQRFAGFFSEYSTAPDSKPLPPPLDPSRREHRRKLRRPFSENDKNPDQELLRVSIIGSPNAGKSVLTNALVGLDVCAASRKVHTTRKMATAVYIDGKTQMTFTDTPGIVDSGKKKKHDLEESLLLDPEKSLSDADQIVVLVDVGSQQKRNRLDPEIVHMLYRHYPLPAILVLNKVDLLRNKSELLNLTYELTKGIVGGNRVERTKIPFLRENSDHPSGNSVSTAEIKNADANSYPSQMTSIEDAENSQSDMKTKLDSDMETNLDSEMETTLDSESLEGSSEEQDDRYKSLGENSVSLASGSVERHLDPELLPLFRRITGMPMHKVQRGDLWKCFRREKGYPFFDAVFMISALDGTGVPELKAYLHSKARKKEWRYSDAVLTDQDPIKLCERLIRAKLLDNLPHQIPYQLKLKPLVWEVNSDDVLCIRFEVICPKDNIVKLVIGPAGEKIASIQQSVLDQLRNIFQRDVYLRIGVSADYSKKK